MDGAYAHNYQCSSPRTYNLIWKRVFYSVKSRLRLWLVPRSKRLRPACSRRTIASADQCTSFPHDSSALSRCFFASSIVGRLMGRQKSAPKESALRAGFRCCTAWWEYAKCNMPSRSGSCASPNQAKLSVIKSSAGSSDRECRIRVWMCLHDKEMLEFWALIASGSASEWRGEGQHQTIETINLV